MPPFERHVFVCTNERPKDPASACAGKGGNEVHAALKDLLKQRGLQHRFRANRAGCLDACAAGCALVVYPEGVWYGGVTVADVPEIVDRHLQAGEPIERLLVPRVRE